MSSISSEDSHVPPKPSRSESVEVDENVENIEPADCSTRLGGIAVKLAISMFALGCLAGALIWSFNNGEAGEVHKPEHVRDVSMNFTIHVSEYSTKMGTYTVTMKDEDGTNGTTTYSKIYDSFWYQDDSKRKLVHRLDDIHTIYVLDNMAFYVTQADIKGEVQHCDFWKNVNYDDYIQRIGLSTLRRHHSEIERKKNHREVFIYEGDPSSVNLVDISAPAFLITAYADSKKGALLGWDTYFKAKQKGDLYMTAYWYDSMSPSMAPEEMFIIPKECEPDTNKFLTL